MAFCTVAEFVVLVLCFLHCVLRLTCWFAFWHFVLLLASCVAFDVCFAFWHLCCFWHLVLRLTYWFASWHFVCCFWRLVLRLTLVYVSAFLLLLASWVAFDVLVCVLAFVLLLTSFVAFDVLVCALAFCVASGVLYCV